MDRTLCALFDGSLGPWRAFSWFRMRDFCFFNSLQLKKMSCWTGICSADTGFFYRVLKKAFNRPTADCFDQIRSSCLDAAILIVREGLRVYSDFCVCDCFLVCSCTPSSFATRIYSHLTFRQNNVAFSQSPPRPSSALPRMESVKVSMPVPTRYVVYLFTLRLLSMHLFFLFHFPSQRVVHAESLLLCLARE